MFAHNAVTNAQAKPRPLARFFGSIKWLKNAFGIGNPGTVIPDCDFDHSFRFGGGYFNLSGTLRFFHSIISII